MTVRPLACALTLGAAVLLVQAGGHADSAVRPSRMNPEDLVKDPLVWRAFRPLVVAVGDGDSDRAVEYLKASTRIVRKADGSLQLDDVTEKFQDDAHASLRDFDLESFFELLPQRLGSFRRFGFAGHEEPEAYVVKASREESAEVSARGERRTFGDSSGVMRMRAIETDDDPHYLLQWRGGVAVGDLSWPSVVSGLSDALRLLDEGYVRDAPLVLQAADAFMRKSQPGLDAEDRRVLSLAWSSYPSIAEHLLSISRTEDVLAPKQVNGCTHLQSRARWHPERIARRYPDLADFMQRMDDLVEVRARLHDASGKRLFSIELESERMESRLEAFVKDGAIVPSVKGKPQPQSRARYERMTLYLDLHFVLRGLHLYIDDMRTDLRYEEHATGMRITSRATRLPKIRVEGAAFGFVPTRVVDWFIPGDMQGLAERFLRTLTEGNEGRGIATVTRFERAPDGTTTLDGTAGAELLDNDLIRFGISFASSRTLPSDEVEADMRKLSLAYRDAFDKDLARFAKYGRPVVKDVWNADRESADGRAATPSAEQAAASPPAAAPAP